MGEQHEGIKGAPKGVNGADAHPAFIRLPAQSPQIPRLQLAEGIDENLGAPDPPRRQLADRLLRQLGIKARAGNAKFHSAARSLLCVLCVLCIQNTDYFWLRHQIGTGERSSSKSRQTDSAWRI